MEHKKQLLAASKTNPHPGSILVVTQRLLIWARHAQAGLARVEYTSELSRQKVVEQLSEQLEQEQILFTQVHLSMQGSWTETLRYFVDHLQQLETGVVSITGFETIDLGSPSDTQENLQILNLFREQLAHPSLRQIWWLTPAWADLILSFSPDLHSWFTVRLRLTEATVSPDLSADLKDARLRADELLGRFKRAHLMGEPLTKSLPLIQASTEALIEVGAADEAIQYIVIALLLVHSLKLLQQDHSLSYAEALQTAQIYIRDITIPELLQTDLGHLALQQRLHFCEGKAPAADLTQIPLEELNARAGEHPFAHPYYWGAWILQGDLTPLNPEDL